MNVGTGAEVGVGEGGTVGVSVGVVVGSGIAVGPGVSPPDVSGRVVGVAGAVVGLGALTGVGGSGVAVEPVSGVPLADVGATDVDVGSADAVGPAVGVSSIMSIPGPGRRVGITVGVDSAVVATGVALEPAFCAVAEGVEVIASSGPPQATNARARKARTVHIRVLD